MMMNNKLSPKLLSEWDAIKNGICAKTKGCHDKVWWKCLVCACSWQAIIKNRSRKYDTGCPQCRAQTIQLRRTNIDSIKNSLRLSTKLESYVYVYLDPTKPGKYSYESISFMYEPFYVGKGTRNRDVSHLRSRHKTPFHDKLRTLEHPLILRVQSLLTHDNAFYVEKELVDQIGRRSTNTGPLLNMRDGGLGYGEITEETRKKLRSSHLGKIPWNKGVTGRQIAWNKGITKKLRTNFWLAEQVVHDDIS